RPREIRGNPAGRSGADASHSNDERSGARADRYWAHRILPPDAGADEGMMYSKSLRRSRQPSSNSAAPQRVDQATDRAGNRRMAFFEVPRRLAQSPHYGFPAGHGLVSEGSLDFLHGRVQLAAQCRIQLIDIG